MINSKTQIIATVGPASTSMEVLRAMVENQLDIVRLNLSWGDMETRIEQIKTIRQLENEYGRKIPIIVDLPGLRLQKDHVHTYDNSISSAVTERDRDFIKFAAENDVDYIAISFVASPEDIEQCRKIITEFSGKQKVIAKIERTAALERLEQIILNADAVMVARGDLGNEVPIEQIPFIQDQIVQLCKKIGKPVIVATQMLSSMVEEQIPTRAEVTDVAYAIMEGASAVMLSEETAIGKYPAEVVATMKKIVIEAEKHLGDDIHLNLL